MKKILFSLLTFSLLFGFGCSQKDESSPPIDNETSTPPITSNFTLQKTVYTDFVINTHDWTDPEKSIATLNKIIDLHEKYQLPVDIFLDDQVTQVFKAQYPGLQNPDIIERLKTSSYVAVSYHLRPPYPYYWDYDWLGLDEMSDAEIEKTLRDYEEHKIDLVTGQPTDEPGGYQLLKDLLGYAPYTAVVMGSKKVMPILAEIYKEKGAVINVTHSGTTAWGETQYGLWMRPEDLEVKVYEQPSSHKTGEKILTDALATLPATRPVFINLKWHENNFYTSGTPWGSVYSSVANAKDMLYPPYDLSQAMVGVKVKTSAEQAEQWTRYEECLSYVKDHPEIFTVINARDLVGMVTE